MTASTSQNISRGIPLPYLAAWRRHNGMSQRGLASAAHVSYASIARLETGKVGARPDTIGKIADALELTRVDLINTKPEQQTKPQGESAPAMTGGVARRKQEQGE